MSEQKRLHPIASVLNFLKQLKELIVPFLVFIFVGAKGTNWDYFYLIASVGVVLFVLVTGVLSWLRFTYRMEDGELRIEYGVFIRNKRYIPFEKIQSLDLSEGILHRPFGLVKVKVETAGSSGTQEAEAVLSAITKLEAKEIEDTLMMQKRSVLPENQLEREEYSHAANLIYKITFKELVLLSVTSGGVGVVISAVLAFIFQFDELIPYEKVFKSLKDLVASGFMLISMLVFLGLLLAWIASFIGTMLKYANFTVEKLEKDIIIKRGLLEKRQITIPLNRIQAVSISENLIRQPLGYGTVFLESAGGSATNMDSAKVMLIPIMKKEAIIEYLESLLPDYDFRESLNQVPERALSRYQFKGLIVVVPIIILAIILSRPWGYFSLLLLPMVTLWQYLRYKAAAWDIKGKQLTLRYRDISKNTIVMKKNKIQSLHVKESYFQRKKDLITVQSIIKSGSGASGGSVIDIEKNDGVEIYQWYSNSNQ